MAQTPSPQHGRRLSLEDREEILDETLVAMTVRKGRVETRGQTSAVIVFGRSVNHVLHLLLTLVSCGLWLPVWLLLAAFNGERRTTINVDQHGVASERRQPMPASRVILIVLAVLSLIWWIAAFSVVIGAIGSDSSTPASMSAYALYPESGELSC